MGAQEVTGKIFNSRTLPKPVIPDSVSISISNSSHPSPFSRPFTSTPAPQSLGSYELPKVKREPSPDVVGDFHRSTQQPQNKTLALAPLRPNGSSPTLLGLASVCSSRSPLPSVVDRDSETQTQTRPTSGTFKSRPYSPAPPLPPSSPYPNKRRPSTSSGETTMDQSPRSGNREAQYERERKMYGGAGAVSVSRDRSGSGASTSLSGTSSNGNGSVRPMVVDSTPVASSGLPAPLSSRVSILSASAPTTSGTTATAGTDRLWANYRPRGGSYAIPPREALPPSSVSPLPTSSPGNLGIPVPSTYPNGTKRPSPSAGESEKEDMDEDRDSEHGMMQRQLSLTSSLNGKDDDSFTSHREKRRVIEKKSRMRRVDALDHLRLVVSREYQYQHTRGHGGHHGGHGHGHSHSHSTGPLTSLHNIDPLTQAPRKNCQADICFEAVEIIEKLRGENDRLRLQNRDLLERLAQATSGHPHSSHPPNTNHREAHGGHHAHVQGSTGGGSRSA